MSPIPITDQELSDMGDDVRRLRSAADLLSRYGSDVGSNAADTLAEAIEQTLLAAHVIVAYGKRRSITAATIEVSINTRLAGYTVAP